MEVSGQLEAADRFTVWYRATVPTVSENVRTPDRSEQTGEEVGFLLLPQLCTPPTNHYTHFHNLATAV